jgi:hypothetical protein
LISNPKKLRADWRAASLALGNPEGAKKKRSIQS